MRAFSCLAGGRARPTCYDSPEATRSAGNDAGFREKVVPFWRRWLHVPARFHVRGSSARGHAGPSGEMHAKPATRAHGRGLFIFSISFPIQSQYHSDPQTAHVGRWRSSDRCARGRRESRNRGHASWRGSLPSFGGSFRDGKRDLSPLHRQPRLFDHRLFGNDLRPRAVFVRTDPARSSQRRPCIARSPRHRWRWTLSPNHRAYITRPRDNSRSGGSTTARTIFSSPLIPLLPLHVR